MQKNKNCDFKIMILGDIGVGKSNIVSRYLNCQFLGDFFTAFGQFDKPRGTQINNELHQVYLMDYTGAEDYKPFLVKEAAKCSGFIFVFSVNDFSSFQNFHYYEEIFLEAKMENECNIIAIANKGDLNPEMWEVTTPEIIDFFQKKSIKVFITSAKTNSNIDEAINCLLREIINGKENNRVSRQKQRFNCNIE